MSPALFWLTAASLAAAGWRFYGWPGVALVASVTVFALLLQLTRALRVMRVAADRPLGRVASAVMFQAGLRARMTMLQVVARTGTLGRSTGNGDGTDDWIWCDDGGSCVELHFEHGRLVRWRLQRPDASAP